MRDDDASSISIAFPLPLGPPYGCEQQMAACLYVTPQPNLNREECKSPGLQISEATQLSGAGLH